MRPGSVRNRPLTERHYLADVLGNESQKMHFVIGDDNGNEGDDLAVASGFAHLVDGETRGDLALYRPESVEFTAFGGQSGSDLCYIWHLAVSPRNFGTLHLG